MADLSPGKVKSDEVIARFVPNDDRFFDRENNKVLANLFELAGTSGMSVTRVEFAGPSGLINQQRTHGYLGFVRAKVGNIRSIFCEKQVFCVYDTALKDNVAHCDVCQTVNNPGAVATKLRRLLQEKFSETIESANDVVIS